MFGEKAFDDFAPQAVGCGIQGDAHLCAPVMPESRQKGLLCKRRFAAGYGQKKRRNPSERGSSEFLPLPIPGFGTENCYRCYFFRKKFEKIRSGEEISPFRLFLFFQQFFKLIELAQFDFMA